MSSRTDSTAPLGWPEDLSGGSEGLNVGLVGSSGGHLAHLLLLEPWWSHHDRFWVTFDMPDSHDLLGSERVDWAHFPTTRNLPNLLRNFRLAWRVLRRERPDVLISTGAAVAFPFFLIGRMMGVRTVFIEVYDRIDQASLTARLCAPLSSSFLVQWEDQLVFHPRAELIGRLM